MNALQMKQYGEKDFLELNQHAPKPVAGKGQVLIEVRAASINPIDWKIRAGYLKEHLPLTIDKVFPLEKAKEGFQLLEAGHVRGKSSWTLNGDDRQTVCLCRRHPSGILKGSSPGPHWIVDKIARSSVPRAVNCVRHRAAAAQFAAHAFRAMRRRVVYGSLIPS
jgi:hypothetical protein